MGACCVLENAVPPRFALEKEEEENSQRYIDTHYCCSFQEGIHVGGWSVISISPQGTDVGAPVIDSLERRIRAPS